MNIKGVIENDKVFLISLIAIMILLKVPTMSLPYHWDETVFAFQADFHAENGFFNEPPGRMFHVPFFTYLTSVLILVFGESPLLLHLLISIFSGIGLFYTHRVAMMLYNTRVANTATILLASFPMYFSMSGQFLYEMPLTALAMATLYYSMKNEKIYMILGSIMCLTKEPGILIIFGIFTYRLIQNRKISYTSLVPLIPFGLWQVWLLFFAGFAFHPAAFINRSIATIPLRIVYVIYELLIWNYLWIPSTAMLYLIWKRHVPEKIMILLVPTAVFCSFFIFAPVFILPRYFLPIVPMVFIILAWYLQKIRSNHIILGLLVILFISSFRYNWGTKGVIQDPMFSQLGLTSVENGELNLDYIDIVNTEKQALDYIFENHPNTKVHAIFSIYEEAGEVGYRKWSEHGIEIVEAENAQILIWESCCTYVLPDKLEKIKSFESGNHVIDIYKKL